ncbi:MAG: M23 family metallopeptidase [Patescibacteria group bacterium]
MDLQPTEPQEPMTANLLAKSRRHKRVFLRSLFFSRGVFRFLLDVTGFVRNLQRRFFRQPSRWSTPALHDPFKKFIRQTVVVGVALLVVTSFAPSHLLETGFTADSYYADTDADFIEADDGEFLPPFLMNDEDFVLNTSPETAEVSRIGLTDSVKHTVVSGDNLSSIAALYGINVQTLVWENSISESSTLKIGQTLVIPSVDGVSYLVSKNNETLSSIAKAFEVDANLIQEHNNLDGGAVQKGQMLFIPGGKKKEVAQESRDGTRASPRGNGIQAKIAIGSTAKPSNGKKFIFPTNGKITQYYSSHHPADDIANSSKPDIWASFKGKIAKVNTGCTSRDVKVDYSCGNGYGNYVIIDHGDNVQTLYAHMGTIYAEEGQSVDTGQAIGQMSNTGRVRGSTGIHLHFEVRDGAVKVNPSNWF